MTLKIQSGVIPPERVSKRQRNIPNGTVLATRRSQRWVYVDGMVISMSYGEWRDFCHRLNAGRGLGQ